MPGPVKKKRGIKSDRWERAHGALLRALEAYRDAHAVAAVVEDTERVRIAHRDLSLAALTLARVLDSTWHLVGPTLRGVDLRAVP